MKRKVIISIAFAIIMTCALIFVSFATNVDSQVHLSSGHVLDDFSGVYYLPASQDLTKIKIVFEGDKSFTYGQNNDSPASDGTIDITAFESTDSNNKKCYKVSFNVDGGSQTITFYAADSLPTVFIESSYTINEIKVSRKKDKNAKVEIINPDGTIEYADTDLVSSQFKVRGNTTPDLYKKPYQIKLGQKSDLFGMGKGKTWILLANYLDTSLLRNAFMFELAQRIGMDASSFQSVDVYVNGCYEGVYLLCEKVNVEPNRVEIRDLEEEMELINPNYGETDRVRITSGTFINNTYVAEYSFFKDVATPSDITGGYLIELDNTRGDELKKNDNDECYFKTDGGNYYVIKSPEFCSQAQMEYIAGLFSEMEEAFTNPTGKNSKGKHYSEYMDIDSFALAYIMVEFGRTYDAGSNSVYFYKDADKNGEVSKFVKGPLWDCDNSLANIERGGAHLTDNFWTVERAPWNKLTQHNDFLVLVKEKYEEIAHDQILDMIKEGGFLDQKIAELGSSVVMDRERNIVANKDLWPIHTYKDAVPDHLYASSANKQWFNRNGVAEKDWAFRVYSVYFNGDKNDKTTVIGNLFTHIKERDTWLLANIGAEPVHTHVGGTATCVDKAICESCGEAYGERLDHDISNEWYTSETHHWYKCKNCDLTKTVRKHEFPEEWTIVNEVTDFEDGLQEKTCAKCGYKLYDTILSPHSKKKIAIIVCASVGGAMLLGGAGFSYYWFVIRKKKMK